MQSTPSLNKRRVFIALAALALLVAISALWWGPLSPPSNPGPTESSSHERTLESDRGRKSSRATPATPGPVEIRVTAFAEEHLVVLEHAEVSIERVYIGEAGEPAFDSAVTDADGSVTFPRVASGVWTVTAVARGHLGTRQTFRLDRATHRKTPVWELALQPTAGLTARIVDVAGQPAKDTRVRLLVEDRANLGLDLLHSGDRAELTRGDRIADAQGRVAWPIAPIDTEFSLICDHPEKGRELARVKPLEPAEQRHLEIQLAHHASIVGRVIAPEGENVKTMVECWHFAADGYGLIAEHRTPSAVDGRFEIRNVSPGQKRLVALSYGPGWVEMASTSSRAEKGAQTDAGDLVPGSQSLRVLCQTDETPQPDVKIDLTVTLTPTGTKTVFPLKLPMRPGAEVELRGLPPGHITLLARVVLEDGNASHPGYRSVVERFRPGDDLDDATLILPAVKKVPRGGLRCVLSPPSGVLPKTFDGRVAVLRDGVVVASSPHSWVGGTEFLFNQLAPGRYTVVAVTERRRLKPIDVDVAVGRKTHVDAARWEIVPALKGRVVDDAGTPLAGVRLELRASRAPEDGIHLPLVQVTTDARGDFEIPALPPLPEMQLWTEGAASVTVTPESEGPVELEVPGGVR